MNYLLKYKLVTNVRFGLLSTLTSIAILLLPQLAHASYTARNVNKITLDSNYHNLKVCFGAYFALYPNRYLIHLNQTSGEVKKEILRVDASSRETKCVNVSAKVGDKFDMAVSAYDNRRIGSDSCKSTGRIIISSERETELLYAISSMNFGRFSDDFTFVTWINDMRVFWSGCGFTW